MSFFDLVLIGVALGTDAFIIAFSNSTMFCDNLSRKKETAISLLFSFFQFLFSLLGYIAGEIILKRFKIFIGALPCVVFYFLAIKLIIDLFKKNEKNMGVTSLTYFTITMQAISVSIDAFIVGVSFISNLKTNIFFASSVIGLVTLIMVILALRLGKSIKKRLGEYADFLGIFILLVLGTKNLLSLIL